MNICVLGGTGFIGTELVTRLVHAGHWVRVPTRSLARADRLRVLDTAELRRANVHDPRVLSQLFADCAVVINLIGILNERGRDTFATVHDQLAARVMSAARGAGVRRVLHMSSLGAAAQAPSRYLRSKAAAEAAVRAVPNPEQAHPSVTIFRPSVIFGAGDSLTNRFAGLLRTSAGILPLARARARFAPISVLDVVEAFVRALERTPSTPATYELCGPEVLTLEEIVRLTARVAGLPCHILRLPDVLARLQGVAMGLCPANPSRSTTSAPSPSTACAVRTAAPHSASCRAPCWQSCPCTWRPTPHPPDPEPGRSRRQSIAVVSGVHSLAWRSERGSSASL